MAVFPNLPHISATIQVNNLALKEYNAHGEDGDITLPNKTSIKYVEAVPSSTFTIGIKIGSAHSFDCPTLSFRIYVDGQWTHSPIVELHNREVNGTTRVSEGSIGKDTEGHFFLSRYQFAAIKTVEDSDKARIELDRQSMTRTGDIEIQVYRQGPSVPSTSAHDHVVKDTKCEVAEKALKGRVVDTGTVFQAPRPARCPRYLTAPFLDGPDNPLAVLIFRYRSRDALKAEMIIPRSPSPDPLEHLSTLEKDRLARDMLRKMADNAKTTKSQIGKVSVKREVDLTSTDEPIDLTHSRTYKKFKTEDGVEAYDLTED